MTSQLITIKLTIHLLGRDDSTPDDTSNHTSNYTSTHTCIHIAIHTSGAVCEMLAGVEEDRQVSS